MQRMVKAFVADKVTYLMLCGKKGREKLYRIVTSERKFTAQLEAVTDAEVKALQQTIKA